MIIHFHVKLHLPADEIPVKLDPNEVMGSAWLGPDDLHNIFNETNPDKIVSGFDINSEPKDYNLQSFFPYFGYPGAGKSGINRKDKKFGTSKASIMALRYLSMLIFKLFQTD